MLAISAVVCLAFFLATYRAGRYSLVAGLLATFVAGYFFGILRANIISPLSHFFFDAALLGLYASQSWNPQNEWQRLKEQPMKQWLIVLILWPTILCLIPLQTPLVTLVGYRGNVFFLPILLLATRLTTRNWRDVALGLATLNIVALLFAGLEYTAGVQRFFPISPVTDIIYRSRDVAGNTSYRIPSIFSNAHSYGGTVTSSLPILLYAWTALTNSIWQRYLVVGGLLAAMVGVLLSSTRLHFLVAAAIIMAVTLAMPMKTSRRMLWVSCILIVALLASANSRMQRFKSIKSTDTVTDRLAGSVNRDFVDVLFEYPMGNGLGGGGTSIPYFLASQVNKPVSIESEYARFLLEEGIPGLLLWCGFFIWCLIRPGSFGAARKIGWICCLAYMVAASIGTGLLTAVPQTVLFLMTLGWITTPESEQPDEEEHEVMYEGDYAPAAAV